MLIRKRLAGRENSRRPQSHQRGADEHVGNRGRIPAASDDVADGDRRPEGLTHTASTAERRASEAEQAEEVEEVEEVEVERKRLRGLQRVIDWKHFEGPDSDELTGMPEKMRQGLRDTTAYRPIYTWVQVRCIETLVDEIGESFNGIDPLRPVFRDKLQSTREKSREVRQHPAFLNMEVALREPLEEEFAEVRSWMGATAG